VTITNGPSITKDGINAAGNPITNVGAGVDATDAVNKGQLDKAAAAAKTEVEAGKNMTVEPRMMCHLIQCKWVMSTLMAPQARSVV